MTSSRYLGKEWMSAPDYLQPGLFNENTREGRKKFIGVSVASIKRLDGYKVLPSASASPGS